MYVRSFNYFLMHSFLIFLFGCKSPETATTSADSTTKPELSIYYPASLKETESQIYLGAFCTEDLQVSISGDIDSPSTVNCENGSISKTVTLSGADGNKVVTLTQTNEAGTTTVTRTFIKDSSYPSVSSVSPAYSVNSGGTSITISGVNLEAGATVEVGSQACTNVSVVSATQITCTAPALANQKYDIKVTNTDSRSHTLPNAIEYYSSLTFTLNDDNVATGCSSTSSTSGGITPYSYSIDSGPGSVNSSGTFTASTTTGTSVVKVTDSIGNILTDSLITANSSGSIDCTFGANGLLSFYNKYGSENEEAYNIFVFPDDKFKVTSLQFSSFLITAFDKNGNIDTSFSSDGKDDYFPYGSRLSKIDSSGNIFSESTQTSYGDFYSGVYQISPSGTLTAGYGNYTPSQRWLSGTDFEVLSNGKILTLGLIEDSKIWVQRFNSNLTLDSTFGTNGVFEFGSDYDNRGYDLIVQSDGKLLVIGYTKSSSSSAKRLTIWKVLSDGSALDTSWGSSGQLDIIVNDINYNDIGYRGVLDSNGDLLAFGSYYQPSIGDRVFIVKIKSNATIDSTFGTSGGVLTDIKLSYSAGIVDFTYFLRADNSFYVGGKINTDIKISKYNSNGSIDTSFGTSGYSEIIQMDKTHKIAVQSDDKILVVGRTNDTVRKQAVQRINP